MSEREVSGSTPALSPAINQRLQESERSINWVHSKLAGMNIPQLLDDKRSQLAAACWHVAVEHSMAIVVLVRGTLVGSALTLIRPLFEAYVRGMWLMHAATKDDIDRAGRDQFPNDFNRIVAEIDEKFPSLRSFTAVKNQSWSRWCSFTHTGYQQIGARLTPQGLGYGYQDSEILQALEWADMLRLLAVGAFATLNENEPLAREVLDQQDRALLRADKGTFRP